MSDAAVTELPPMPPAHTSAVAAEIAAARADPEVTGLMLCGSCARGNALPGSDLDLRVFLHHEAPPRAFESRENSDGVFIERSPRTFDSARDKLRTRPMEVYPYLEGIALYDPDGVVADLKALARTIYGSYRAEDPARRGMAYWLESAQRKIAAAMEAGETGRAAFVVTTTAWPMLEALFLAADRPAPPSGAVVAYLPDACARIGNSALTPEHFARLWSGDSATERCEAALTILGALLPALSTPPAPAPESG